jgi:hypothetical protein
VGIPRVVEENGKPILKLIRQEYLEDDSVEAIFIDEYNRAPKKMKNAVMELVQFKSVNGRKYPNLKVVWAAVNPEDDQDTYDVEPLDPAQKDRFHIHLDVEYRPCPTYLESKYGHNTTITALEWWNKLTDETKNQVSPRRLCYALDHFLDGGDLRDILPSNSNVSRLSELLNSKPIDIQLKEMFSIKNDDVSKLFINNENNLMIALDYIKKNSEYMDYFIPLINNEKLSSMMSDENIFDHVMLHMREQENYKQVCASILQIHSDLQADNKSTKNKTAENIKSEYMKMGYFNQEIDEIIYKNVNKNVKFYTYVNPKSLKDYITTIETQYNLSDLTQQHKDKIWNMILGNMPETMDMSTANGVADIINKIANESKVKTPIWERYKEFIPVVNTVSKNMFANGASIDTIRNSMTNAYSAISFQKESESYIKPR